MDVMGILNSLKDKLTGPQLIVSLYISANSSLEGIYFDVKNKTIINTAKIDLHFDLNSRHISDTVTLENAIKSVLETLEVKGKPPVSICLPPVLSNKQDIPAEINGEELHMVLMSEAEKNYIFKKQEPCLSWLKIKESQQKDFNTYIFTATQQNQIDEIKQVCKKLGLNLVAIDSSQSSTIRGLANTNLLNSSIEKSEKWYAVLISQLNFATVLFEGTKIIDYYEKPIALKSMSPEEIEQSFASHCYESIKIKDPAHFVIINEIFNIKITNLEKSLNLKCKITRIEQNQPSSIQSFENNKAQKMNMDNVSLATIGMALWTTSNIQIGFNFLHQSESKDSGPSVKIVLFNKNITLTGALLEKILLISIGTSFIVLGIIFLIFSSIDNSMEKTLQEVSVKKADYDQKIQQSKNQETKSNVPNTTQNKYESNTKNIQLFNALGTVIPEKVWIESYMASDAPALKVVGRSYSVEDIFNYFQNLKALSTFKDLKIASIKVQKNGNTSSDDVSIIQQPDSGTEQAKVPTAPQPPRSSGLPSLPNLPVTSDLSGVSPALTMAGISYYEFTLETSNPVSIADGSTDPSKPPEVPKPPTQP